ncbi:MAG: energy transducer TonB [Pseudomonadota bacterium]
MWWALCISITLHVLFAFVVPKMQLQQEKKDEPLTVQLAPKPAEPLPVAAPEPVLETPPPPPPPVQRPEPVKKPDIKPKPVQAPSPVAEPPPADSAPAEATPQPPAVITAEPKVEAKPAFTAPPPPPEPQKAAPAQQDLDAARNQYGNLLAREIAKHKQYPRIAQMRGWEGEVTLELQLDSNGNLTSSKVFKSSNYEALDKQALEMVKKASPFPLPPDALRGRSFTILVPVSFKLDSN